MAGVRYLVDTNILIRSVHPALPEFELVSQVMHRIEETGITPYYTSQNLGEFWNVLTRPADRNGYGLSPEQANLRARAIEAKFKLLPETAAVHPVWRHLLTKHQVCGVQVHDARLVATMQVHGVRHILTFNAKDFARFDGVEAIHPAQFV